MKTETPKDASYYMALPYTRILSGDDQGDAIAKIQELPGCVAHGKDDAEALTNLRAMQKLWLEDCIASGNEVPQPEVEAALPSGKWLQRVPRSLHKKLTVLAKKEGISLNQLVAAILSEAVAARMSKPDLEAWIQECIPQIKLRHPGHWGAFAHDLWGCFVQGSNAPQANTDLLHALNVAGKLVPTHAESTYEKTKAIPGYKEAAENARRRR